MRTVEFGRTGRQVSALALGCMSLRADAPQGGKPAVWRALEAGITFFDTADVYGRGESEKLLGEALREAKVPREQVFIASKCGIVFPGMDARYRYKAYDLSADYITQSCEASLKRLGVDYLDLYQPHRIDYLTHPGEVAGALDELREEGKIRAIGLSNHHADEIRAVCAYTRVESLQTEFSLLHLEPLQEGLHAVCMERKMAVLAWSPLARGKLTGASAFSHSDWQEQRDLGVLAQVRDVAAALAVTPTQAALAWLMALPGPVIPLLGTANPEHVTEAVGAVKVSLKRDDWYELMTIARGRPMPWQQRPFAYHGER